MKEEFAAGERRGLRRVRFSIGALAVAAVWVIGSLHPAPPAIAGDAAYAAQADTMGSALTEWAYDRWTVPWVQVQGPYGILMARSYAVLQVLACARADLERERLARHLSAEECEHRMTVFRADQDTSITFLIHFVAFDVPGARQLLELDPSVRVTLEDDTGRRWAPISVKRGARVPTEVDLRLRRIYDPPWLRNGPQAAQHGFEVRSGKTGNLAEHVARFSRRDPVTGDRIFVGSLRWIRLRVSQGTNEWVATWPFRTSDEREVSP